MALVNLKSDAMTKFLATPRQLDSSFKTRGSLKHALASVVAGAADNAASTYQFFLIPSDACMKSLTLYNTAGITGATTADIGLYAVAADGTVTEPQTGAKSIFATALTLATTRTAGVDVLYQNNTTLTSVEKRLWERLGTYTADPVAEWVLALTATTNAFTAGGTIALHASWSV